MKSVCSFAIFHLETFMKTFEREFKENVLLSVYLEGLIVVVTGFKILKIDVNG